MTVDAHGVNLSSTTSQSYYLGCQVNTNANCTLTKVTKHASCDATTVYICTKADPSTQLASWSFSGDDATGSLALTNNVDYLLLTYKGGSAQVWKYNSATLPVTGTNIDWLGQAYGPLGGLAYDTTYLTNIVSIESSTGPDYTKVQVNIGDVWKSASNVQINIGDAWKTVTKMEINIGDTWKTVFSS